MKREELQNIVNKLSEDSTEESSFGIFQYGGGSEESYIKATKQGLIQFSTELLQIVIDSENEENTDHFMLNFHDDYIHHESTTFVEHVEVLSNVVPVETKEGVQNKWSNRLVGIGCAMGLFFILLSLIVGIVNIALWVF